MKFLDWFKNLRQGRGVTPVETGAVPVGGVEKSLTISNLTTWASLFQPGASELQAPYRTHPWIHRAIRVKEQAVASLPIRLYRETGSEPVEIKTHPILEMLANPNEQMSGRELTQNIVNDLDLCGNALIVVIRSGSSGMLIPLNPRRVDLVRNGNMLIGYEYRDDKGALVRFAPNQVLHIRYPSDEDILWGVSPMEAARRAFADDVTIRTHNRSMLANNSAQKGVLKTDQVMTETQVRENQVRWEAQYSGAGNAGKTPILTGGLDFKATGITQQDFDFMDARKFSLNEIAAVFGVPASKMNAAISDESNHRSMERSFWNDTMLPLTEMIADAINSQMWKLEGAQAYTPIPMYVAFDTTAVPELMRQRQEMQDTDLRKVAAGVITQNEFREKWGEGDPVKWGDSWWKPFGLEATSDASAQEPAQPDDEPVKQVLALVKKDAPGYAHKASDAMQWLAFMARLAVHEGRLASALRGAMTDIEREVIEKLKQGERSVAGYGKKDRLPTPEEIEAYLFDKIKLSVTLTSIAKRPLEDAQRIGGERGLRLAGRPKSFLFRTADINAIRTLRAQLQRFAEPVADTTWERLKEAIAEALNAGESIDQITQRVRDVMDVRRIDAARTAQTETAAAVNGGVQLGFMQSKVVKTKRWITAGDDAVRDSHKAANGQEVSVGSAFTVGGASLAFPGDPNGPAGEVINCRCTIVPGEIVEDEDAGGVEVQS